MSLEHKGKVSLWAVACMAVNYCVTVTHRNLHGRLKFSDAASLPGRAMPIATEQLHSTETDRDCAANVPKLPAAALAKDLAQPSQQPSRGSDF